MESPLEVLSRAATMVASANTQQDDATDSSAADAALKRRMEERGSPPRDLPSKIYKYKRMKERQYLLQKENETDKVDNNKKCAGTQTPFSSFASGSGGEEENRNASTSHQVAPPHSSVPPYPDSYRILDLDQGRSIPDSQATSVKKEYQLAGTHPCYSHTAPHPQVPPHRPQMMGHHPHMDPRAIPINLVTTGAPPHQHHSELFHSPHGSEPRPSVITSAQSNTGNRNYNPPIVSGSMYRGVQGQLSPNRGREITTPVGTCDPSIEEHFRRSLGKKYPEYLSSPGTPTKSSASPTMMDSSPGSVESMNNDRQSPNSTVSVTGTVDDHFAKALGDKWVQLNAEQKDPLHIDLSTGTVDDHFAKALGDTWFKIKAEKELDFASCQPSGPQVPM